MSKFMISLLDDKFVNLELRNEGIFSLVYTGRSLEDNKIYAIKMSKATVRDSLDIMINEFNTLQSIEHENAMKALQFNFNNQENKGYYSLPLGVSLRQLFLERKRNGEIYSTEELVSLIRDVTSVLIDAYKKGNQFCHYDLRPENIIYHDGRNKVMDWCGTKKAKLFKSTFKDEPKVLYPISTKKSLVAYEIYAAPEVIEAVEYADEKLLAGTKSDVFSLGLILLEALGIDSGEFSKLNLMKRERDYMLIKEALMKKMKKVLSDFKLQRLIEDMIHRNPALRPSAEKILNEIGEHDKERRSSPLALSKIKHAGTNISSDFQNSGTLGKTEMSHSGLKKSTGLPHHDEEKKAAIDRYEDEFNNEREDVISSQKELDSFKTREGPHFKLRMPYKDINDSGLTTAMSLVGKMNPLLSLKIDVALDHEITNVGVIAIKDAITMHSNLMILHLDFSWCKQINDEGLRALSQCFSFLKNLQNLKLVFHKCRLIGDEGLIEIAKKLHLCPQIRKLWFDFYKCRKITHKGVSILGEELSSLHHLKDLQLDFSWAGPKEDKVHKPLISDESFRSLSNSLLNFPALENFSFDFIGCDKITDIGMTFFAGKLIKLENLLTLSLNLYECRSITDKGLQLLAEGIQHLSLLQKVVLYFGWCNGITDDGVAHLARHVAKLENLTVLSINFSGCKSITDKSLDVISDCLFGLGGLNTLTINFSWCSKISDMGLEKLAKSLAAEYGTTRDGMVLGDSQLENLTLGFRGCFDLTKDAIGEIAYSISRIDTLRKIDLDFKDTKHDRLYQNFIEFWKEWHENLYSRQQKVQEQEIETLEKKFVDESVFSDHRA